MLRLQGHRARRISQAKKRDFRAAALESGSGGKVDRLIANDATMKRKRGEDDLLPAPRTSKHFVRDNMYQYMLSAHRAWTHASHVNVVLDGVRVDTEDLVSFVFFSPEKQVGNWGPPQVPGC